MDDSVFTKLSLQMARATYTSADYFINLPLDELIENIKELNKIAEKSRNRH